ncbi:MAG: hypothetical protein O9304_09000 [Microcystis sp. LE19-114.1B]|nr:hypothetical protein [Microcystis sp. LE19-114.1B]
MPSINPVYFNLKRQRIHPLAIALDQGKYLGKINYTSHQSTVIIAAN